MILDTFLDFGEIDCTVGTVVNFNEAIDLSVGAPDVAQGLSQGKELVVHWTVTETFTSAGAPQQRFGITFAAGPDLLSGAGLTTNYTPYLTGGPINVVYLGGGSGTPLVAGADFYSPWPRMSDIFSTGLTTDDNAGRLRYALATNWNVNGVAQLTGKIKASVVALPYGHGNYNNAI